MRAGILALTGMLLLTGCMTVGPDYKPPKTALPAGWNTPAAGGVQVKPIESLEQWWSVLNDPVLTPARQPVGHLFAGVGRHFQGRSVPNGCR